MLKIIYQQGGFYFYRKPHRALEGGEYMKFVFYNIAPYAQVLREAMLANLHADSKEKTFYCIEEQTLENLPDCAEYIIFYLFSDKNRCEQIYEQTKGDRWKIKKVALCKNYEEGITAMEKGNDYALKVPIEKEKVLCCLNYLMEEKK